MTAAVEITHLFVALLAAIAMVACALTYRKTRLPPYLALVAGAGWLVWVRIGIAQDGSWIDVHSQWLVLPTNILYTVGFVWVYLIVRKWYGPGGSR